MAITEAQRANRHKHLGSSDMPAIMGCSPFASAYDVWLEKTRRVPPRKRTESYILAGDLLESPLIIWLSNYLGQSIHTEEQAMELPVVGLPIVVHLDGEIVRTRNPVECKTEGVDHPVIGSWGEAGTDEVPEYTCIQTHCHLMATDREICHVPAFIGGRGFGYYFVKRDTTIVQLIREQAIHFWEDHVLKDIPPEECAPTLEMAKRIRHVKGDPVALGTDQVQKFLDAREASTAAEKVKKFHHAGILASLDGARIGVYEVVGDDGEMKKQYLTNFDQTKKGIDRKALLAAHPEIHDEFYIPGEPFGVLRPSKDPWKKAKK